MFEKSEMFIKNNVSKIKDFVSDKYESAIEKEESKLTKRYRASDITKERIHKMAKEKVLKNIGKKLAMAGLTVTCLSAGVIKYDFVAKQAAECMISNVLSENLDDKNINLIDKNLVNTVEEEAKNKEKNIEKNESEFYENEERFEDNYRGR